MALKVLPIDNSQPFYSVDIELSKKLYRFEISWNERCQFWTMSIYYNDQMLASGKIVSNYPLFHQHSHLANFPPGYLYAVDITGKNQEPTFDTLGTQILIMYDTEDLD